MSENSENLPKTTSFGVDPKTGELLLWKYRISMPKSRLARIAVGMVLIFGGIFSFLPFLGIWMLPLGLLILSHDLPIVRRWRRKLTVWWERRKAAKPDS